MKPDVTVRRTRPEDLPTVLSIYEHARAFMRQTGNPNQWGTHHPPVTRIEQDIAEGKGYVIESEGTVHGTFFYDTAPDPTYAVIEGAWKNNRPYGVIHRIASDGVLHGILAIAADFARTQCSEIRIDTHEENVVMQHCLQKYGFRFCGIIHLENGDPRRAYQFSESEDERK